MSAPIIPAIASWFAPAAASTAAATTAVATTAVATSAAATFSGSALGLIGGALGGIGQGLMASKERKDDERERREEEQRQQDSYRGAGEAVRFWEKDQAPDDQNNSDGAGPEFQRADAQSNNDLKLGQREQRQRMGQQFRNQNRKPQTQERFKYDRDARSIVPA